MACTRAFRIPVLLALVTLTIGAMPPEPAGGPPGVYIVQVAEGADPGQVGRSIAQRTVGKLGHVYTAAVRGFSIQLPPGLARQEIEGQPGVLRVEPDVRVHAFAQTLPTGVDRIDADRNGVAKINGIDERVDVDIAIIDTGIDIDHPDLNVVGGRHFYSLWGMISFEDDLYDDDNGHGTHCAGIAAALDNDFGVVGVAPGARLWAVKVLDSTGSGYLSDVIAGIDWVTAHAATIEVANMSLGAAASSSIFRTAIQNGVAAGVVYVVAAGNDAKDVYGTDGVFGTSDDFIPAAYPEAAAVSAMCDSDGKPGGSGGSTSYGSDDSFASFSNYSRSVVAGNPVTSPGKAIDLLMPGVSIYSCWKGGGYATASGTSMASPHGAGLAALYIAGHGRASNASGVYAIRQALIDAGMDQTAAAGLKVQNDPDGNKEKIGWAASAQTQPFTDVAIVSVDAPAAAIQGATVSVSVTVRNAGNQDVASDIIVTLEDTTTTPAKQIGTQTIEGGLRAGASTPVTFAWNTGSASIGKHTLTATHNVSGDQNHANDSASDVIDIVASLTDIAITSVTGPGTVTQGNAADIVVTVKNVGNQNVAGIAVTLADTPEGGTPQTIDTKTISSPSPGASTTLTFTWNTTTGTPTGNHTLMATHGFADDDPANNEKSTTVNVVAPSGPPVAHVGVVVSSIPTLRKGWKAMALVTVIGDDAQWILYATVEGKWTGIYNATVTGSTDDSGTELFVTKQLSRAGTVTFTVTRIVGQDGQVYELDPPVPFDSYTGP